MYRVPAPQVAVVQVVVVQLQQLDCEAEHSASSGTRMCARAERFSRSASGATFSAGFTARMRDAVAATTGTAKPGGPAFRLGPLGQD